MYVEEVGTLLACRSICVYIHKNWIDDKSWKKIAHNYANYINFLRTFFLKRPSKLKLPIFIFFFFLNRRATAIKNTNVTFYKQIQSKNGVLFNWLTKTGVLMTIYTQRQSPSNIRPA